MTGPGPRGATPTQPCGSFPASHRVWWESEHDQNTIPQETSQGAEHAEYGTGRDGLGDLQGFIKHSFTFRSHNQNHR